ncbi:MAG: 2-amino-4-hydroxy-6-hydroxymethyldihydropteridine diphosphokinase [Bacteroidia bacterium]|nr:2-amino-4-hydroxy-6-hydroxymethyldihydropteridine diphosphokinase [Bacteroidia bacterium]
MKTYQVFLGLGSNLGDKQKNIERAYKEIEKRIGKIVSKSAFYVSPPDGFESENQFVNTVCRVVATLNPRQVLQQTQEIEKKLGRTKKSSDGKYADRVIDIDILMFDNLIIEEPGLLIPHPRFHRREFVLVPFAEISPDTIHPVLGKSIRRLTPPAAASDGLPV